MNAIVYDPQDFRNHEVLQVLLNPEAMSQDPGLLADLIDPAPNANQYAMAGCLYFQRHGKYPRKPAQCAAAMKLLGTFQRTLLPEVSKMRKAHERESIEALTPKGTTAEIATEYNISKSEVRRLKADGLLHTLSKEDA